MFALSLENNQILQYGILFFIMRSIPVRFWRYNLPKYARVITKSFLDTVLATGFGASISCKNSLMQCICQPNHAGSCFYTN